MCGTSSNDGVFDTQPSTNPTVTHFYRMRSRERLGCASRRATIVRKIP
jgi:hypothetical protein